MNEPIEFKPPKVRLNLPVLPLIPLVRENLLDLDTLIVDSKSGVSGAGRSLALTSHFCEVN